MKDLKAFHGIVGCKLPWPHEWCFLELCNATALIRARRNLRPRNSTFPFLLQIRNLSPERLYEVLKVIQPVSGQLP